MKKILCVAVALATTAAAACLTGCFDSCSKSEKATAVSTYDELVSARGNVILANDIDCDFATITSPIKANVDGHGYTVKNAVLSGSAMFEYYITKNNVRGVKNIVLENISYENNGNNHASLVCGYNEYENIVLENITVKNCSMKITQGEKAVYAGIFAAGIDSGKNKLAEFKNCKAENVTVEISGSPSKFSNLYFGGLIGHTINDIAVENCSVTGCDFLIGGKSNTMYVGGLVGGCTEGGTIKNSFVKETSIIVEAPWYSTTFGSMTGTSAVQLGGLIGHFDSSGDRFISYDASGEITSSYVSDSNIRVSSSGSSLVGGLAGYFYGASVSQSYSCNNNIAGAYYDFGKQYYTVGGLIASAKDCTVTSCFSCANNVLAARKSTGYSVASSSLVAGFMPTANSVDVNYCGVGMNKIAAKSSEADKPTDERLEEFMFGGTNLNNFVTSPLTANNACNLETVSESLWYTPQEIKNKLNLTDGNWEFEAEKLPYLNLEK